jgi:hypothetical protein
VATYEYRCEANGRLVEVRHEMAEELATWGELWERAGMRSPWLRQRLLRLGCLRHR